MSRKSLLIAMMLAFTASVLAQTAPPRPHDPEVWEWIDYYNPDYPESSCMSTLMFLFSRTSVAIRLTTVMIMAWMSRSLVTQLRWASLYHRGRHYSRRGRHQRGHQHRVGHGLGLANAQCIMIMHNDCLAA